MGRRKFKSGRAGLQGQKWVSTSLSENARSLTATVASLELDPSTLPATSSDEFDVPIDDSSSDQESVAFQTSTTPSPSVDNSDDDEVSESEHPPACDSTTVAEELHMDLGGNNAPVRLDDDCNGNSGDDPEITLTPTDCATLDVLKLCHDAGVSLEFYDILFALLRKHSTKNKVDITKLPKRDTFLKNLRERISSPLPIISQAGNLQVPHFDMLSQTRDLLGSFIFNDINNLCVNTDPEQRHKVFA